MITILGASGFIGSHLVNVLRQRGVKYYAPNRNEDLTGKELGDVIFCIGLTSDAKYKPHETIDAQVIKLQELILNSKYNSILYCSSTRVYIHNKDITDEDTLIGVDVNDSFELFNLTKLLSESLLKNTVKNYKIVRLSNVIGNDFASENFITSIIKDAISYKKVELRTTPDSSKDYIFIGDAVNLIIQIALSPDAKGVYNVASGFNTNNENILNIISKHTDAEIIYSEFAERIVFKQIDTSKIKNKFNFKPTKNIVDLLPEMIDNIRNNSLV
jgi:nucleoside-diphosphate-sugar epimerase